MDIEQNRPDYREWTKIRKHVYLDMVGLLYKQIPQDRTGVALDYSSGQDVSLLSEMSAY